MIKFTRWPPSCIWAFQVSGLPQLLSVTLTIMYACQDHVLERLKMAFCVVIIDSKYSKMTPKFVKQKSHWLHPSIKFANPVLLRFPNNYGKSEYPQALNASYTFQPLMSFWLSIKDISVTVFACCRYRKIINCCLYCCLRCTFLCF